MNAPAAAKPIRVLVVDDSATVRRLLSDVLRADPAIEVVGTAPDGDRALHLVDQLKPDLITLDVEMPVMDGLTMLSKLRAVDRKLPVIMVSTLTLRGGTATLDALSRGANDYVTKPSGQANATASRDHFTRELIPRIKALAGARLPQELPKAADATALAKAIAAQVAGTKAASAGSVRAPAGALGRIDAVVIASSTGGPNALETVIGSMPSDLAVPVLVVQHMPPMFTRLLAERLDGKSGLSVREVDAPTSAAAGHVYIAPGDHHMTVATSSDGLRLSLNQGPAENSCRPAADVLFRSAAAALGARVLGVVLTGMGFDGLRGAEAIVAAGGQVLAQDQASSVVWGMPGAVAQAGFAAEILPLHRVPGAIEERVSRWSAARRPTAASPARQPVRSPAPIRTIGARR